MSTYNRIDDALYENLRAQGMIEDGVFVSRTDTGDCVQDNSFVIGVSTNNPTDGEHCSVLKKGTYSMRLAAAVAEGSYLMPDANGYAIADTNGDTYAKAVQTGVVGQIIPVEIDMAKRLFTHGGAAVMADGSFDETGINDPQSGAFDVVFTPNVPGGVYDIGAITATGLTFAFTGSNPAIITFTPTGDGPVTYNIADGFYTNPNGDTSPAESGGTTSDSTAPIITLVGAANINLNIGDTYTEQGATSDTGEAITVTGTVNTAVAGTYPITYTTVDAAGNVAAQVTRNVIVAAAGSNIMLSTSYDPAFIAHLDCHDIDVAVTANTGTIKNGATAADFTAQNATFVSFDDATKIATFTPDGTGNVSIVGNASLLPGETNDSAALVGTESTSVLPNIYTMLSTGPFSWPGINGVVLSDGDTIKATATMRYVGTAFDSITNLMPNGAVSLVDSNDFQSDLHMAAAFGLVADEWLCRSAETTAIGSGNIDLRYMVPEGETAEMYQFDIEVTSGGVVTNYTIADVTGLSNPTITDTGISAGTGYSYSFSLAVANAAALIISMPSDVQNAAFKSEFDFDQNATGFDLGDIVVTNGTASNLVAVSGSKYIADITADSYGVVSVSVGANAVTPQNNSATASTNYTANSFYGGLVTWENPNVRGKLGSNTEILRDWTPQVFTDLMKQSRPANGSGTDAADNAGVIFDADGWPTFIPPGEFVRYYINVTRENRFAGQHHVIWDGTGTISYHLGINKVGDMGGNHDLVEFDQNGNLTNLVINTTDPADPIRNVRVYMPGGISDADPTVWHESAATVPAGENYLSFWENPEILFNPMELNSKLIYSKIRFMNWQTVNNNYMSTLAQFQQDTSVTYQPALDTSPASLQSVGHHVPVEVMAEFCQIINAHPAYNVPHLAEDAAIDWLASEWNTHLPDGLDLDIVYSNEVWNSIFNQAYYARSQSNGGTYGTFLEWQAAGSPSIDYSLVNEWVAAKSSDLFARFEAAFGNNAHRINKVVEWQAASSFNGNQILSSQNLTVRPDAYSVAFYISNDYSGIFTVTDDKDDVIDKLIPELDVVNTNGVAQFLESSKTVADAHGLDLLGYEGGHHLLGSQFQPGFPTHTDGFPLAARNAIYDDRFRTDIYAPLLNLCDSNMTSYMHYKDAGTQGISGYFSCIAGYQEQGFAVTPTLQALNEHAANQ